MQPSQMGTSCCTDNCQSCHVGSFSLPACEADARRRTTVRHHDVDVGAIVEEEEVLLMRAKERLPVYQLMYVENTSRKVTVCTYSTITVS